MQRSILLVILVCGVLIGCSTGPSGSNYQSQQPQFELFDFFNGNVKAWGIVQNRSGEVVQRFIVTIDGSIEGNQLTLDETFTYGLGAGPTARVWTIVRQANGEYVGRANDIANDAKGIAYGNAFNFSYEMDLPVDGSTYRVAFDDWFWAFDNNTLMNRSYIKKFGITMAEVTIFMQKQA